jgi:hypothetical protein
VVAAKKLKEGRRMKLVGTSAAGNPMVEIEPADRTAIREAGDRVTNNVRELIEFFQGFVLAGTVPAVDARLKYATLPSGFTVAGITEVHRRPAPESKRLPSGRIPKKAVPAGPGKSPVRDLALDILAGAKEPMTPTQIANGIEARGYKFTGSSGASACVGSLLRANPTMFRAVGKASTLGTPALYVLAGKPVAAPTKLDKAARLELLRERNRALAEPDPMERARELKEYQDQD